MKGTQGKHQAGSEPRDCSDCSIVQLKRSFFLVAFLVNKAYFLATMRVSGFEIVVKCDRVVAFRGGIPGGEGTNKKRMCIDRGTVTIQKRNEANCHRLVLYPKGHTDLSDLEQAIIIPFGYVGHGGRRIIKSIKTTMKKGEMTLDLKSSVDCRIDSLEQFTLWLDVDEWATLTGTMAECMNNEFPYWASDAHNGGNV
jgi:hypothetical protein